MKTLVIFFADDSCRHIFDSSFGIKNAFDLALEWASSVKGVDSVPYVLSVNLPSESLSKFASYEEKSLIHTKKLTSDSVFSLLEGMAEVLETEKADNAIFSWADLPFLNLNITEEILKTHIDYKAEYTFADGYPYGFTPEVIDSGTVKILRELAKSNFKDEGEKKVSRTVLFDFLKNDINSFEVETCISDVDMSLLRLNFTAGSKLDFLSSLELYKAVCEENLCKIDVKKLCQKAEETSSLYKTVPAYYNIQLTSDVHFHPIYEPGNASGKSSMDEKDFSSLLEKISDFSEEAVVCPSFFGEPLLHPKFLSFVEKVFSHPFLSLLVETDGILVSEELCQKIKEIATSSRGKCGVNDVIWIVRLDSFSEGLYKELHSGFDGLGKAKEAVLLLEKYFPHAVFPQFVRMKDNESELESFWRFWSNKENGSGGEVLIQKYSSLCKVLPDRKSADLSPLERNPCYHLRRDMSIFADGSVPLCRETGRSIILGNVNESSLEEIFRKSDGEFKNHLGLSFCPECGKCDEYYTFNF